MKEHNKNTELSDWINGLVERYEKPLCSYAYSILRDSGRARDVVQDTFLKLCEQSMEKLDGHEAAWLFRVCRCRAVDIIRKERPMTTLTPQIENNLPSGDGDPASMAQRGDLLSFLPGLMAGLPEKQRDVIRLKFQQDLSYREIAETLQISIGNVGFLMHTGIKNLRREMSAVEGV